MNDQSIKQQSSVLVIPREYNDSTCNPLGTEIAPLVYVATINGKQYGVSKAIIDYLKAFNIEYQMVTPFGDLKPFDDSKQEQYIGNNIRKHFGWQDKLDASSLIDNSYGLVIPGGLETKQYEILLARYALEKGKPILAICAGQNVLIRAAGGVTKALPTSLREKHNNPSDHNAHGARFVDTCRNVTQNGIGDFRVNSIHTTVIDPNGFSPAREFLKPLARDEDGYLEMVCDKLGRGVVLGTRFHPESIFLKENRENLAESDPVSLAVLEAFSRAVQEQVLVMNNRKNSLQR